MKWLITFERATSRDRIVAILEAAGAKFEPDFELIPLDENEVSVEAECSAEASVELREFKEVTGVFPSSEMTYFD